MSGILNSVTDMFVNGTGFSAISGPMIVMWLVSIVLMYLAIVKKYEPLLLLPIAIGALAVNIPSRGFYEGGWGIEECSLRLPVFSTTSAKAFISSASHPSSSSASVP